MKHNDVAVPRATCPHCAYEVDSATPAGRNESVRAKPGDVSVCLRCAGVLEFGNDLVVRAMPEATLDGLPEDVRMEIYRVRVAIRRMWRDEAARS